MKAQTLIRQSLSSPAHRLAHVFLIVMLGLGVLWWAMMHGQPAKAQSTLGLSKDNGVDTVVPGQTLVYRVVITNTGVDTVTGIRLTDILPDHTSFDLASDGGQEIVPGSGIVTWPDFELAANSSVTRLLVITVNNPWPGSINVITNTVSLRDNDGHTVVYTDTDSVEADPVLTLVKTNAITTTSPGDTFSYAITLTNHSDTEATGVLVTDTLPAGVTFVDADYGGTETVSGSGIVTWPVSSIVSNTSVAGLLTVTVNSTLPAGIELLVNTIQLTDDVGNTATTKHANIVDAAPDLALTKSDGGVISEPGDILTYTLAYTNSGTQDATGVVIAESVPAHTTFYSPTSSPGWSCAHGAPAGMPCSFTIGDLAAGDFGDVTFAVRVDTPLPAGVTEIDNTASITDDGSNGTDLQPADNTDTITTTVDAAPTLVVNKSNNLDTIIPGQMLIYQIVITNTGNQAATGIRITDTLPADTMFYLASDAGQETTPGSGVVTWPALDLPGGGASVTRLLAVTVDNPLPAGVNTITNTVTLRDDDDNTATAEDFDAVDADPVLTLDKTTTVTTTVTGATLGYTLTLTNHGDQAATGIRITDTLPAGVTFAGASDGGVPAAGGIVTWPTFSLAGGGASVTRLLTVTVDTTLPAGLELLINTARASEDRGNTATAQHATVVDAAPDLVLAKSGGGVTAQPGDTLVYTLTYTNAGNQDATSVVIAETAPAHTTFNVGASNPDWNCVDMHCTYTVGDLAVSVGGLVTFTVNITNPLPVGVTAIENTAAITDDGGNGADPIPANNSDTITTSVVAAPDLVVSKDDDRAAVEPGETLAYLITITNTGNIAAMVNVTDTLPANTAILVASDGGTHNGSGVITWPIFTLPGGGASVTRLVVATVGNTLPAGVDALTNTVTVTTSNEADGTDNTAWDVNQVNAAPDLMLSKSDGGITVAPGDTLVYTLTYANAGNQGATGVVITETVPAHTTFNVGASNPDWNCVDMHCTYTVGDLAVSVGGLVTFTVNITNPLPVGVTAIENTAAITDDDSNGADSTPANNIATTATPVEAAPDLEIGKSNGVDEVTPGDTLIYTLVVTNTGDRDAASVTLTDNLPAHTTFASASDGGDQTTPGIVTWPAFALAGGGTSATRVLTVTVVAPFPADTNVITNTATVADAGTVYATATDVDTVDAAPVLALSKDNDVTTVTPGSTLIYRLVITNSGNQLAAGIVLTDTLPDYTSLYLASHDGSLSATGVVTWPAFDLPGGGVSTTRLLVVSVDTPLPAGVTALTNTAALRDNHGNTAGAEDSDTVNANPDFILTKTSAVTTTTPGATFNYTITLTNNGNQDATGVVITDTLPADVAFVSASHGGYTTTPGIVVWPALPLLASGASVTRVLSVTVNPTLPAGLELLINTVDAADDRGNTATNQHATIIAATPDLEIDKSNGVDTVEPGDTLVYTLTITNSGPQGATGIRITDELPMHTAFVAASNDGAQTTPGIVTWPTFPLEGGGASVTRLLTVTVVNPYPADTNVITNTASVADDDANGPDPTPQNITTDTDAVFATPQLVIAKSNDVDTAYPGDALTYRITLTNTGNLEATNILITDTLPISTTFIAASDGGAVDSGVVTWPTFSLVGGDASVSRLVIVTVDSPLPAGVNAITNTVAAIAPGQTLLTETQHVDTVIAAPDLALTKRASNVTVEPGDALAYTLTYANLGNQEATSVIITETVPAHSTFDPAASHPNWICTETICTYAIASLPAGTTRSITFTVNVTNTLPTGITQIVNAAGIADDGDNGADTNPLNNTAGVSTPVIAAPDLTLTKSDGSVTTAPGATLVYTLTYVNVGNQAATNVIITETVPAHTTFNVAASTPGWTCADGAPAGTPCTYDAGNLEAGDSNSNTIQFAVNVVTPIPAGLTHIHNTAAIADDGNNGADPNLLNNSATIATPIEATPDLEISKSNGVDTVEPGDTLVYTLTVTNNGPQGATGARITDELPAHTTFVSASDGGAQTTPGIVTWPTFPLEGGGVSVTRQLTVTVADPFPVDTNVITNTATVADDGANGPDPTPENNTAVDVDDVVAAPILQLSKSNDVITVTPGSTLIYRLVITNSGTQLAAGIVLSDTLPEHTAFVSASDGGQETSLGSGVVTWPTFTLPARNSTTRLLVVTVDTPLPAGVTGITNTAALRDNRDNTATAQDTDAVDANPLLVLHKTNAVDVTTPGETLVYTLTLTNNGNQEATGVLITDTLTADVSFVAASDGGIEIEPGIVAWPAFNLAGGGASVTRFLTVTVNPTLPAGLELLINTARAREERGYSAIAQHTDVVEATPDLEISKSNGVDTVEPGDTLVYTLTITNSGPQGATGVRITDNLPAHTTFFAASDGGSLSAPGVVTWPLFELPGGGASVTRAVTVTVIDPFPADTNIITNTATVTDDGTNGLDPTPENNTATDADTVIAMPNLLMSKDDGLTTVVPGSTIIYRLVITNAGRQLAAGIHLTDTLPAQTTFDVASDGGQETAPGSDVVVWPVFNLAGGASTTRLVVASVDNPLPAGVTAITNTAVLRDNRGNTAADADTDAVDANPLLFLDKTNAVDTTVPGATLVYTLTLTNNGNQEATGILITDTLPADVTFVAASGGGTEIEPGIVAWPAFNLAGGGASTTRFLTVTVNATLPAGVELLINTARAIEDRGYDAIAQHVDVVVAAPDLAIAKTDGGISPQPGDVLVYTLTYANVGEQGATGAIISETVPAHATFTAAASNPGWTCVDGAPAGTPCTYTVGDLPVGASGDITFAVRVVTPLPVSITQTENEVSITDDGSNGADTDPANNTASIVTPLDATIDLLITKDDGGTTVEPSETIVYTLTYANNGDQIAGGVIITETVPALTTFNQTASSPGWTCVHGSPAGTVCTYPLGDVIEGDALLFAVDVVLPFPIEVSEISNEVVIGADANNIPDANPDDNTATVITPVITRPDLVTGKDDRFSVVQPGQQVTYIITATNVGTQNATNVQLTDTLPIYVSFLGASDGGTQSSPGVVTWPVIAQLALDEIITRTLTVMVDSTLPAGALQITNTVTVSDDGTHGPDLNPANNTATDVNVVGAMPDLVLDKTVNHAVIYPDGLLVYTIRVENAGSRGATGVTIVDDLPPDAHFVSASDGGYESALGVVTWPSITLNVGEEAERMLTARVTPSLPEGVVLTNTATVSDDGLNGEDPVPENNTDTASSVIKWPIVYLPLVMRGFAIGPDLIVDDVVVGNGDIAITIRNQGRLIVTDTLGFWVDLYINPLPAPTQVNQTWDLIAPYGAAWAVDREAIPILPGESRTLYLYDIYYNYDHSRLPVALRAGDIIYVQVDSYNGTTNYGVVYEDHEMGSGEYNNIVRLIVDTYMPLNPVTSMQHVPVSPDADAIPERP
ncbi:MAG: hypothetical protein ACP5J4_05900 [Anaerolineae bacterium]